MIFDWPRVLEWVLVPQHSSRQLVRFVIVLVSGLELLESLFAVRFAIEVALDLGQLALTEAHEALPISPIGLSLAIDWQNGLGHDVLEGCEALTRPTYSCANVPMQLARSAHGTHCLPVTEDSRLIANALHRKNAISHCLRSERVE
jgi:hypothetical protein